MREDKVKSTTPGGSLTITMTMAVYIYRPLSGTYLPMKDHRHPKARDKFDNILLPITICCMHASMPPKRTSRRLRGYPPESQERVEVGSADEEASPPPGSARLTV